MKSVTYQSVCEDQKLKFVSIVTTSLPLNDNQYFAVMVREDHYKNSPHIKGIDKNSNHHLVGIEGLANKGCYISKSFYKRRSLHRGETILVETDNPENHTIL